eukprot:gene3990-14069_t
MASEADAARRSAIARLLAAGGDGVDYPSMDLIFSWGSLAKICIDEGPSSTDGLSAQCGPGKQQLFSIHLLHEVHLLLFETAVMYIIVTTCSFYGSLLRKSLGKQREKLAREGDMRLWKQWEKLAREGDVSVHIDEDDSSTSTTATTTTTPIKCHSRTLQMRLWKQWEKLAREGDMRLWKQWEKLAREGDVSVHIDEDDSSTSTTATTTTTTIKCHSHTLQMRLWKQWEKLAREGDMRLWKQWEKLAREGDVSMHIDEVELMDKLGENGFVHMLKSLCYTVKSGVSNRLYVMLRVVFRLRIDGAMESQAFHLPRSFNFLNLVGQAMEVEFSEAAEMSWIIFFVLAVFLVIPQEAYPIFWLSGLSLIIVLTVSAKLQSIAVHMAAVGFHDYGTELQNMKIEHLQHMQRSKSTTVHPSMDDPLG